MSQVPSQFLTLDSQAFDAGNNWSAQKAKAVENARLRLRRKEQHLFGTAWSYSMAGGGEYVLTNQFTILPADAWVRIMDPVVVPKAFAAVNGCMVITYITDQKILVQATSRAHRFDPTIAPTATGTALDLLQELDVKAVSHRIMLPMLRAGEEEFALYARPLDDTTVIGLLGVSVVAFRGSNP